MSWLFLLANGCAVREPDWPEVARAAIGNDFACALLAAGDTVCWGYDLPPNGALDPPDVPLVQIDAGSTYACAVDDARTLHCWGEDTPFTEVEGYTYVSASVSGTCALRSDGTPDCWGMDVALPDPGPYLSIGTGRFGYCALRGDGGIFCECEDGDECGFGSPPEGRFATITVGDSHACALTADGVPECWGGSGESIPPAGVTFSTLSAGDRYTCGVTGTELRCWAWFGESIDDLQEPMDTDAEDLMADLPDPEEYDVEYRGVVAGAATALALTRDDVISFGWGIDSSLKEHETPP